MDARPVLDVTTIASRVWEALDPEASDPVPIDELAGDLQAELSLEDLAQRFKALSGELERCRLLQQRLERQLGALTQELRMLPAHIVRLEQWRSEAEARLSSVEIHGERDVAPAAPDQTKLIRWRSVRDVARTLDINEGTVRRYVRQGKLRAVRLPGGRGVRICWPEDLQVLTLPGAPDHTPTQNPSRPVANVDQTSTQDTRSP